MPSTYLNSLAASLKDPFPDLKHKDDFLCPFSGSLNYSFGPSSPHTRCYNRQSCHKISYEVAIREAKDQGRRLPKSSFRKRNVAVNGTSLCRSSWLSRHCECFSRRTTLYWRLRLWMPKGLRYCSRCAKFTRRKRNHRGICKCDQTSSQDRIACMI